MTFWSHAKNVSLVEELWFSPKVGLAAAGAAVAGGADTALHGAEVQVVRHAVLVPAGHGARDGHRRHVLIQALTRPRPENSVDVLCYGAMRLCLFKAERCLVLPSARPGMHMTSICYVTALCKRVLSASSVASSLQARWCDAWSCSFARACQHPALYSHRYGLAQRTLVI